MKTVYDELVEEGCHVLQTTIIRQGLVRFGPPSREIVATIRAIDDFSRLEDLTVAVVLAKNWHEMLTKKVYPPIYFDLNPDFVYLKAELV